MLPDFPSIALAPRPNIFSTPTPDNSAPAERVPGPVTPHPGELSDVTSAIYQLPAVQQVVTRAHDEGMRQLGVLRREWNTAPRGQQVAMVTMATVFAGTL